MHLFVQFCTTGIKASHFCTTCMKLSQLGITGKLASSVLAVLTTKLF